MKYVDEFRDGGDARRLVRAIAELDAGPCSLMEVCGGQTHAILRFGIDRLLPPEVTLLHGPGCPVCVTPLEEIDKAIVIAARPEVMFCSFGDMLRVPGSGKDLLTVKAEGGDVRAVYSPLEAVELARQNPSRQVVFFAVGFETTAPTTAMAAWRARQLALENFSLLVCHVRVPPVLEALLASPANRVEGFLAAGHVCTVMGYTEYEPIAARYRTPIVVTGFEPLDILRGLYLCLRQLKAGRHEVENQYDRCVRREGNPSARALMAKVYRHADRPWRGLGVIPAGGYVLSDGFRDMDALERFPVSQAGACESAECRAGEVLQGHLRPDGCPAFGTRCTPERPLGAPMVSSEGACAAYYRYRPGAAVR